MLTHAARQPYTDSCALLEGRSMVLTIPVSEEADDAHAQQVSLIGSRLRGVPDPPGRCQQCRLGRGHPSGGCRQ